MTCVCVVVDASEMNGRWASSNSLFWVRTMAVGFLLLLNIPSLVLAEWSATGGGGLFYTDNANLFSATRRSSLDGDPSQPVLDTSPFGHGKDMVFEPNIRVMKFIPSSWGQTAFVVKVRGFVYAVNPEFSQTGIYLEGVHVFNPDTAVRLRFFTAPDQLLGQTSVEHSGFSGLQDARVTSHIGAVRFDKRLSDHWEIQLYGRAGIRRFNEPFAERDTLLWTIGTAFGVAHDAPCKGGARLSLRTGVGGRPPSSRVS